MLLADCTARWFEASVVCTYFSMPNVHNGCNFVVVYRESTHKIICFSIINPILEMRHLSHRELCADKNFTRNCDMGGGNFL